MSEDIRITIGRRWFGELWSEGKLEVADEIIAPDYAPEWVQIDATGPDQVKHEVRYFRSVFPDLVYEVVDIVSQGDAVWVRYHGSGTQHGAAWGFEPTNKKATFEGATILTINEEGKITDRWGAFCMYDILADLDLVPPFWELRQHFGSREQE
jgi:predicted ester cyclase